MSRQPKYEALAITGTGWVTNAGWEPESLWQNVLRSQSLVREGLCALKAPHWRHLDEAFRLTPFLNLTLYAIRAAMREAGWDEMLPNDGLVLGSTTGNILEWEPAALDAGQTGDSAPALRRHEPMGTTLHSLCQAVGARGPARLISTACSSSTQAIALGALWVQSGKVRRCLVVGAEVLSRLTVEGFRALQLLSPRSATPFDQDRVGINLAEGAAALCLEKKSSARAPLALLSGWGLSSDAHHLTAPHPEGAGCFRAMRSALNVAGLAPEAISWIHAHGTGSVANDLSEGFAIERLFGREATQSRASSNVPWVSSTKGVHGHFLAASGAVETLISIRAIRSQIVPPTAGLKTPDSRLALKHPTAPTAARISHVMKNSLGFGGANASIILSHAEDRT